MSLLVTVFTNPLESVEIGLVCFAAINWISEEATTSRARFWHFLGWQSLFVISANYPTRDARVRIVDLLGPLIETPSLKFSRVLTYVIMNHEHDQSMSVAFLES